MSDSSDSDPFVAPSLEELAELFPGYAFNGLIACGGMGAVYAAVQRSLDREVAIKILPREFGDDEAFRAAFETEAKAMARLNHPNLIGVYDFGDVNGMLFIVMEFVPGQSLYHSAHGTAIDAGEVVRLISGICRGLAHAHGHGIIHRDIKPANILLDLQAEPKIGDFGLARPVENKAAEGEEIFGTPHYTAPEVVESPLHVDHRADIFSVGVMLHELLTGRLPADDPRPPSAIIHCDPRFDNVVQRATDPNPANRYDTADQIVADLEKISTTPGPRILQTGAHSAHRASHALPDKHLHPTHKQVRKVKVRKSSPAAATFLILLLLGAGIFVAVQKKKKKPADGGKPPVTAPAKPEAGSDDGSTKVKPVETTAAPTPEPATSVVPDTAVGTAADPDDGSNADEGPDMATKPVFDVDGFLLKAKNIMAGKARPLATTRDSAIANNLNGYQTTIEREIRRISVVRERDLVRETIRETISDWQDDDGRIPDDVPEDFEEIRDIEEHHRDHLQRQRRIDDSFQQAISKLDSDYQRGIQLQIDRLDAAKDPVAVRLLTEEIERARDDAGHFIGLVLPDEPVRYDD